MATLTDPPLRATGTLRLLAWTGTQNKAFCIGGGQGLPQDDGVGVACGQTGSTSREFDGILIARSSRLYLILRWESTFPGRLASYKHDGPCVPGWDGVAAGSLSSCGEGSCR